MLSPEQVQLMVQDIEDLGLEGAAALYGMSVEEFKAIQPIEEYLEGNDEDQPIDLSGPVTQDQIDALLAKGDEVESMLPIGSTKVKKAVEGIFKPKIKPLTKQRKSEKQATKELKDKKNKELEKNKQDAADNVAKATTAATVTALGLSGDRAEDGSLKVVDLGYPEVYPETDESPVEELEISNMDDFKDAEVEAPKEERPGWYKPEGSNFWSIDTDSPHWQTDEGAAEATEVYGELPSWAKQPERQELDLSAFSNWLK